MPKPSGDLTPKQARFVDEYLIDLNATQAAIRAGYSAHTANEQGSRLLANVSIQAALAERRVKLSVSTGITPERVLEELGRIGFSDMRKFAKWGSTVALVDSATLSEDDARCVAEVSERMTKFGPSLSFKLHDKVGALTQIGRHFGMFTDKIEDVSKLSREERRERLLKLVG